MGEYHHILRSRVSGDSKRMSGIKSTFKRISEDLAWDHNNRTPAPSEAELRDVFERLGFPLTEDVVELYSCTGGCGIQLFEIWTLSEILEMNQNREDKGLLWFGDWLIHSHVYAFEFVDQSTCRALSTAESGDPSLVADSVREFFEKLLRTPDDVHVWMIEREA